MRHLTPEQLVDLADGVIADASTPHLASCGACRRQLADLRAMMSVVADIEVPEPSPLFWDHLSARVRDGVGLEREAAAFTLAGRSRTVGTTVMSWFGWHPAAVGAFAVLVLAVGLIVGVDRTAPVSAPERAVALAGDLSDELASVDNDPALSLVADLAAELDWEAARETGLITHAGADEDALKQLTAAERQTLHGLLQGLSQGRSGA